MNPTGITITNNPITDLLVWLYNLDHPDVGILVLFGLVFWFLVVRGKDPVIRAKQPSSYKGRGFYSDAKPRD